MRRRHLIAATLAAPALAHAPGQAQGAWPNRTVRIINPYAPGGTSDLVLRPLTERLERAFGRPFIIDNRTGAGGSVGTAEGARAAPDGHTLLISNTGPLAVAPSLFASLPYDPQRAFAWISVFGGAPILCAVKGDGPIRDMAAFRAAAARQAEAISFGSSGVGSVGHLTGVLWSLEAGVQMLHAPFRGAPEAQQAVLGGTTDALWDTVAANAAATRAGSLRGLAVSSPRRVAALPDVPTLVEQGFPNAVSTNWFVLAAPAGLDPAIGARINEAIQAALIDPPYRDHLSSIGVEPIGNFAPADIGRFVAEEQARWAPVVRAAGLRPS
jgi:tripartite-type tricarboxylate transporter receptor subunit TctC